MRNLYKEQIELVLQLNYDADYRNSKEQIKILLKELARRLLLWSKSINDYGIQLNTSTNLIFDVAQVVMGEKFNIKNLIGEIVEQESDKYFSFFDKYVLAAYFNCEKHRDDLLRYGFCLPNPYRPYLEIFKLGGYGLKYESPMLEVYPFLRVVVHPQFEYMSDIPFWNEDLCSTEEE